MIKKAPLTSLIARSHMAKNDPAAGFTPKDCHDSLTAVLIASRDGNDETYRLALANLFDMLAHVRVNRGIDLFAAEGISFESHD